MPIYEFRCESCDAVFEQIRPIGAADEEPCPECGARARRLISRSSFQLKGSGWYATDYRPARSNKAS